MLGERLDAGEGLGQQAAGQFGLDGAVVAGGGELGLDGHAAEDRQVVLLGNGVELAGTEDLDLLAAIGTLDICHVLDDAEDGDVHLLGHVHGLGDDHGNEVLRARHDDDAIDGQRLEDGESDVGGAGRHVNEQVVERAPGGLAPELADCAGDDGAAPQDGIGLIFEQQVARHDLDAVVGDLGQ